MPRVDQIRSYPQLAEELTLNVKKSWLGKHVKWLKDPEHGIKKYGKLALVGAEFFALSASCVGIPVLLKAFKASKQLDNYEKLKSISKDIFSRPEIDKVEVRSTKTSFNHLNEYVIHEDKLWFKPIGSSKKEWQLMYFDGYLTGEKPISISADGANFAVADQNGAIHYKKILDESRLWFFTDKYEMKDLTKDDNWYDQWFSFPIVSSIYHLFNDKVLTLPKDSVAWAMSHRGKFVRHFDDKSGHKHPEFAMVTTLFCVTADRKNICYADPFVWNRFKNIIPGPSKNFLIDGFSASASTLAVIGKKKGKTKICTLMADFDTVGRNPFLPGFWFKKFRSDDKWQRHSLKLEEGATLTNNITIFQNGTGNNGRELRVEGTSSKGSLGYYYKSMTDKNWSFRSYVAA